MLNNDCPQKAPKNIDSEDRVVDLLLCPQLSKQFLVHTSACVLSHFSRV